MKMKIQVALTLAVVACFQLAAADSPYDDVEPMQPHVPFDPWWAEGPLREVYDAVDSALTNPHIVGGKESTPHSHPHQVALKVLINQKTAFCGGSLISDQWVVTAGHCASGVQGINVTLGAHNIKQQESTAKTIKAVKIIVHPGYSSLNIRNDIALLQLESRVTLDKNVNTIRLPKVSQKGESFYKKSVTMTGWGKDSDSAAGVSPVLREVDSEVVSNLYCSFRYFFGVVQDSNICASGWNNWKTRGTCNGDSGGPMVVKEDDGERTLIGVTSFGIAFGCQWSWPPVFTRVTSYLDWIQSTTGIAPRP